MQLVTTIGLGIAKSVLQVHGVDASGQVIIRRRLMHRRIRSKMTHSGHRLHLVLQ